MCGIAGYIDLRRKTATHILQDMTDLVKHRGPDDEGYTLFEGSNIQMCFGKETISQIKNRQDFSSIEKQKEKFYFMGLGHRRLSIIDLSEHGHQPMADEGQELFLTYNGEIYNYIEIKKELKEKGYQFTTTADSEVILNAYKEWGENCVKKFNGMWAFAIYDRKRQCLFCSRDRLGVKPFYYYYNDQKGLFVFGSELKQIIAHPEIKREINAEILAVNMVLGISDYDNETLIKDVHLLGAGENMILSFVDTLKMEKKDKYWDLADRVYALQSENYVDLVGEMLESSVCLRLRSDAKLGALLSGGLDSSALVTLISNHIDGLETFTSCYHDSPENDEKYFAQLINKNSGCVENLVYPECKDIQKDFERIVWHTEGISSYTLIGTDKVIRAAREKGIKVILNGQAGDETMFGYERYYAFYYFELLKRLKWGTFFREFKLGSEHSKLTMKEMMQYLLYFKNPSLRSHLKIKQIKDYCTQDLLKNYQLNQVKKFIAPTNLEELQYNELRHVQLTHILRWDDRLYMANSVESRVPFVDYRFVELAANIPNQKKIENGYTKALVRKYMDDKMPKEVTWRTNKMGFGAPTNRWAGGYSSDYIHDIFTNAKSKRFFHTEAFRNLYQKDPGNSMIQKFISTEMFFRLFQVES